LWDKEGVPLLEEYIRIPNQSLAYDKDWNSNGLQDKAAELLFNWAKKQPVKGLSISIEKLEGKSPMIFATVEGTDGKGGTVLMYGHFDKQPPLTGSWSEGLDPYIPVIRDGKLYGRGGADDGYSIIAALGSVAALQAHGIPHSRIVIMVEGSEESGSPHLEDYVNHLADRIGSPNLVVCLDSGCGNYEQFWITTNLRGLLAGVLKVKILNQAIHSGSGSGIVPSSFRITRQLLNRIENVETGDLLVPELYTKIPEARITQAKACAASIGQNYLTNPPLVAGAKTTSNNPEDLIISSTWKPTLSVTGVDGIPPLDKAGNVIRTHTSLMLSVRVPPGVDTDIAGAALKKILEKDPPYGAEVSFKVEKGAAGWESPALSPWLENSMNVASNAFFNKNANFIGEGGSIPFMGMLGRKFPQAQFVITGVLGPHSNAHGPDEFYHIDMGKKVSACVSKILSDQHTHFSNSQ